MFFSSFQLKQASSSARGGAGGGSGGIGGGAGGGGGSGGGSGGGVEEQSDRKRRRAAGSSEEDDEIECPGLMDLHPSARENIFTFLSIPELGKVAAVCKTFSEVKSVFKRLLCDSIRECVRRK